MDVFDAFRSALKRADPAAGPRPARPGNAARSSVAAGVGASERGVAGQVGGIVLRCPGMAMVLGPAGDDRDMDRY